MLELLWSAIDCAMRLVAWPFDRRRIIRYFTRRGHRVDSVKWTPLATGWMSNWHDRFYKVTYHDDTGATGSANCRTSIRTGVVILSDEQ